MKAIALALVVLLTGCARHLPPHVWIPIQYVEGVDLFWWTDQQLCNLRVIWSETDEARSFTVPVESGLCLGWLKAQGYQLPAASPRREEP